ncbi:hypothetical protein CGRA01v4_13425 [Colletotrichum graminicola]|uniref:AGC-kinase C-terminal domain-containing protein n=1 Tax=Colletotrichum graminicola (strain M1.001 / M2 / FGSC 10212) TaxID=645133 RepID=E3QI39_COLGM|nr:uncharacterized protein GLRG_05671 [Colletotrichum graminicola M1.001]EFQ30527.1 hypothetical protein GLRG_05671 [Colletotrichum graminicola M1.001]WDK22135.1 hypothetical protein CGRA01v4_13425 [Colletotrichum graminicola]
MFSHLRIHRRGQSNPTSPNPDQSSPWDPSLPQHQQHSPFLQDAALSPGMRPQPSTSPNSSLPPTLPPITRVTSSGSEFTLDRPTPDATVAQEPAAQRPHPPPPAPPSARSTYNPDSGFLGGVALRKYEREQQLKQQQQQMAARSPDSAGLSPVARASHDIPFTKSKPAPPPIVTSPPAARPPPQPTKSSKHSSSFTTPTELQHHGLPQSSPQLPDKAATGRRPAGTRLSSEPVRLANHNSDAPKGRKGLPFLKNPMSTLLARRRTSQNAPDLTPLPLRGNRLAEPTYDPRIRGTRVHDFSAPRPRRSLPNNEGPSPAPASTSLSSASKSQPPTSEEKLDLDLGLTSSRESSALSQAQVSHQGRNASSASESGRSGSASIISQPMPESGSGSVKARNSINLESKPLPDVPFKNDSTPSSSSASVISKRASVGAVSFMSKRAPSTKAPPSRHVSMSGQDILSSVPRHMKSTSSRFSFDMAGAAKQEKLLEERHRQRELERKTSDPEPSQNRDSRFDDFDEDFDYDAMMEDDGFEEPIPMSNDFEDDYGYEEDFDAGGTDPLGGDAEEGFNAAGTALDTVPEVEVEAAEDAEDDPDNDQENFAGFVFQRSNPPSALASPHSAGLVSTPRDADGRVIGFAYSGSPNLDQFSRPVWTPGLSPHHDPSQATTGPIAGLAIEGLDIASPELQDEPVYEQTQQLAPPPPAPPSKDDLYFDNGLLDELEFAGEGDGSHFDESIFDLDDTDQYGRPIPGAFAAAQAARAAAAATTAAPENSTQNNNAQNGDAPESSKRISDSTSRLSAQSNTSQSTGHTSLSVSMPAPSVEDSKRASEVLAQGQESSAMTSSFSTTGPDKVEAYQTALAAAAFEAAANGRFRRDSSPPPSEIMSPGGESSHSVPHGEDNYGGNYDDNYDDYDDGGFREDLNDYDVDYDDFIAEANASALANDSDGWYGQEFGFYSAPIEGGRHSRDSSNGSDEKPFEYANGGFFGPSGVSRSKSGRIVSREPNLTPITERSEYSNRNSIMSLGVPPIGSGPSSLQSPGLAQLAMMADGDENMSISALMRLRSRAWGGSQASLVSSREGSPRSERGEGGSSPWGPGPHSSSSNNILGIHGHARKNSSFSVRSRDMDSSDAGSTAGSPTMTMSMPTTVGSPPPPLPSLTQSPAVTIASPHFTHSAAGFDPVPETDEMDEMSISNSISHSGLWMKSPDTDVHPNLVPRTDPTTPQQQEQQQQHQQRQPGMGHKHKGSADSISYVKEEEEGGETRWVLERRFTADSGEIEVQREVVGKGHI